MMAAVGPPQGLESGAGSPFVAFAEVAEIEQPAGDKEAYQDDHGVGVE